MTDCEDQDPDFEAMSSPSTISEEYEEAEDPKMMDILINMGEDEAALKDIL